MRLSACVRTLASTAWAAQTAFAAQPPIRTIYTFPNNTFIENIAVRPNSHLLLTSMSVPSLYTLDPTTAHPTASIIHTFPNATGLSGIAEISPDKFALVTGVWDQAITRAQAGTLAIWTVDLSCSPPAVQQITHDGIPESTIFNGVARHPTNPSLLLAADSAAGAVWRVDLTSGVSQVAFSSALLKPVDSATGSNLGINGFKAAVGADGGAEVWFTNSAQGFLGKVAIDWEGNQIGEVEVVANSTAAGPDVVYDDFALTPPAGAGKAPVAAWIAAHPSYAVRVSLGDGSQRVVNDTVYLRNPTSAAFGRGGAAQERTLYVTDGGLFAGNDLVEEGVVAVDLS